MILLGGQCNRISISESHWGVGWGRWACWQVVNELPSMLKKMLGKQTPLPRQVVTDRGPGFYQASSGTIVAAYKGALYQNLLLSLAMKQNGSRLTCPMFCCTKPQSHGLEASSRSDLSK